MLFALICIDKQPEGLELRKANRREHLEHLKALGDRMKFAGPFTTEDGARPTGSLIVIEADSQQQAEELAAKDPYAKAGVFASVDIRPWTWLLGRPEKK